MTINIRVAFADAKKRLESEARNKMEQKNSRMAEGERNKSEIRSHIDILQKDAKKAVSEQINKDIGMRLGNFRDGKGLSQKRIMDLYAKHTGEISSGIEEAKKGSSMSRYENGKRGIDLVFLVWLAQEFHVDLHWLLTGETWEPQDEVVQKVKEWYRQGEQYFQKM